MVCIQFNESKPDKCQFIILGNTFSHTLQICDITVKSASSVTLLGITIDPKLNFKEHINNIVKDLSNIRKSQNLSMLNYRKSICLLPINLDVVLKSKELKRCNIKLYK